MNAEQIAQLLRAAELDKKAIAPITPHIGKDNLNMAYEIQQINVEQRISEGAIKIGKKIGLTSFAVQKQLGVDQPDFGVLFNEMEILNGQSISFEQLMQPKIESEIAFVLGMDLDSDTLTMLDVLSSIDYCLPALEIVGSRIANWEIGICDTIADNASASHYVLGHTPKTLDEFDVINCKMTLHKNGTLASEGVGSACLGSPLNALLWLAKKMNDLNDPLLAGDLILSGAVGPMVLIEKGDTIESEIENLGTVSVSFD